MNRRRTEFYVFLSVSLVYLVLQLFFLFFFKNELLSAISTAREFNFVSVKTASDLEFNIASKQLEILSASAKSMVRTQDNEVHNLRIENVLTLQTDPSDGSSGRREAERGHVNKQRDRAVPRPLHASETRDGSDTPDLFPRETLWHDLGVLSMRNATGWSSVECNTSSSYKLVQLPSKFGNVSVYVYDSILDDLSTTTLLLKGEIPEQQEIEAFLQLSEHLPLLDVGANLGTVALQAALQGRHVVALEPVLSNAQRLCRASLDFGLHPYLHVLLNAASDHEGEVTLAADYFREMARYSVQGRAGQVWPGYDPVKSYAIPLDALLDRLPFTQAAIKIDVEGHEGYVLAGSERLFQQLYTPLVWLEWEHVKHLPQYGATFILDFMRMRHMIPHDVITTERLSENDVTDWPATVLWIHESFRQK